MKTTLSDRPGNKPPPPPDTKLAKYVNNLCNEVENLTDFYIEILNSFHYFDKRLALAGIHLIS